MAGVSYHHTTSCISLLKMSSDIYAVPDVSKKLRHNRKVEGDEAERKEKEEDIYKDPDTIWDGQTDFQSQEGGPLTLQHPAVQTKSSRRARLCLAVLSLLMTVGIIILSICFNNYSRCQRGHETLRKNYSLLQDEMKTLKDKIEGKSCPEGWTRFGCSCYFKSTEQKSWYDSRTDCQSRGSDLLIINSKEEQEFLTTLLMSGECWIGLRTVEQNGTHKGWEWEWVDGSPLTQTFWVTEQLEDPTNYLYATCDQHGKWRPTKNHYNNWMCEK